MPPPSVPPASICILRLSALGDVTHVVPVIRTLQRHWPATRLTWIVGHTEHKLVGALEGVEFITFDKRAGGRGWRELRGQLHGRRFDVLLHMQVSLRANLLSLLVRAPLRVGYDRVRAREFHRWMINRRIVAPATHPQHVLDAFGSFLEPIGLRQTDIRWNLPIPPAAHAWAVEQLPGDQPTLVISGCSSHRLRNWSAEGYAAVAEHAVRQHHHRVVLVGGRTAAERAMGDAILARTRQPVGDLIGRDTFPQLLALLQRADVLLSPDSGPMHLANAVGTPVIGLHACTDSRRSGPYSDRRFCVDRFALAAQQCKGRPPEALRWGTRLERPGIMDLITVPDVIAAFDRYAAGCVSRREW